MSRKTPENFLKQVYGRDVLIKLNSGCEYTGTLAAMDALMNVVLENAEEKLGKETINKYVHLFLRGNNGNKKLISSIHKIEAQRSLKLFLIYK